eukprot:snap_masked-scaffold_10-processed-gene-2.30-mRNA-1 protein AED:0.01 eAED:0.01 QI:0/-1/0/1/-1/1/1/0/769
MQEKENTEKTNLKTFSRLGSLTKHLSANLYLEPSATAAATNGKIIYTLTDEAPMLATYSLYPILNIFCKSYDVPLELLDISVAHRVLNLFFPEEFPDNLSAMGKMTEEEDAFMIKLPNISASLPQLLDCIKELQSQGFKVPNYADAEEKYAKVLGSNVNPVLRQGNSDRRVAKVVKEYAKKFPHKFMKPYPSNSSSRVVHMSDGDFYESEKSVLIKENCIAKYFFTNKKGEKIELRDSLNLQKGEVLDGSFLSVKKLKQFFQKELVSTDSKEQIVSVHLKATMMKISDPIIFGYAVEAYYESVLKDPKYEKLIENTGFSPRKGIAALYSKLNENVTLEKQLLDALDKVNGGSRPEIAMVDSSKGITNLHVPSDVIIDASMPVVIRDGGKMWNKDDKLKEVKCLIPDRCYATTYKSAMEFCKKNGEFDPSTMGSVSNVGLMARKAEEYGSHDKTFEIPEDGEVEVEIVTTSGSEVILRHQVEKGDIYRGCQAKKEAIDDWINLALTRGNKTGNPLVFWLDQKRAHDRLLIDLIKQKLESETRSFDIKFLPPEEAILYTMERCKSGLDTISATGNVLRDYLTDLFPILELGTSAKMLSIVPLLAGGGLYETGAGGSAPKHIKQLITQGHLRWDSLGEFLAFRETLRDLGEKKKHIKAEKLGSALEEGIRKLLWEQKSPGRKVGTITNSESHFWLTLYWAEALSEEDETFKGLFDDLSARKEQITEEFKKEFAQAKDIGGYYWPDPVKADHVMRPVKSLNELIEKFSSELGK